MSLLDPVNAARREMRSNSEALELLTNLDAGLVTIAPDGTVALDQEIAMALAGVFPRRRAADIAESIGAYASGGMFVPQGEGYLIPWRALEEISALVGGTPQAVRKALGLNGAVDADVIHDLHPSMGKDLFTAETAVLLSHAPRSLAHSRIDDDFLPDRWDPDPEVPPVERGNAPLPDPPPSKDDYLGIARCVIGGSWGPYFPSPFGWLFGCSVRIDYVCADALSRALLEWFVPGKVALGKALLVALNDVSISAGLQTLGSVAGFWIAAAFFATGFQVQTANLYSEGRGVDIHFPWPGNPLPVFATSR